MTDISTRIKEYALEIGFSGVGIARADDFAEYLEVAADRGEELGWWITNPLDPLKWARPANVLPNAKSLLVVYYDYAQQHFPDKLSALLGRIYQSRSYVSPPTNINGARIELLKQFLTNEGITALDATWLPQRWAGVRAGLTTFGRNTFAYAPGVGSFIVLFTFILDVELAYDESSQRTCLCPEDCTRCIDACPTGALDAPFHLNAKRCIAYNNWMPGALYVPRELRPLMGQRIHGCDYCQEACPRNKAVLDANKARPHDPLLDLLAKELTLEGMLHLSNDYYEQRVRPVMYNYIRNHALFQRNAAIAIGNSHDARYLPDLALELDNPDPLIRAHVAWALGQIGGDEARALLDARQAVESDEVVCEELRLALGV